MIVSEQSGNAAIRSRSHSCQWPHRIHLQGSAQPVAVAVAAVRVQRRHRRQVAVIEQHLQRRNWNLFTVSCAFGNQLNQLPNRRKLTRPSSPRPKASMSAHSPLRLL